MREIQLTQGKVAIVDDVDYEYLNQWKWYAHKKGNVFYAARRIKKEEGMPDDKIYIHQFLLGKKAGFVTDHINGNGLDNRHDNIRQVTIRENLQNLHHVNKTSKYPGVYWQKAAGKWHSKVRVNGERKYLGLFINEIDAFDAYRKAVKEITGKEILECYR